jgi:indole-3-glycerol phosphate synthase/phosphoribosylanthranilate isomerase
MALETIVAHTRDEVRDRQQRVPLEGFRPSLRPSDRSLAAALSRPGVRYILECKKASPSRGLIRPDFDPQRLAEHYAPYADAISVLTNERFFQGKHEFLQQVRQAVQVPVLCKDFVVDPYQVYEARHYGADAILLMLSVLDDEAYRRCTAVAAELELDVLTEVHDEEELKRALALEAPILGINNRNLKTLDVDLKTTERLAPHVPPSRLVVSESGIAGHGDVLRLQQRADAFLVGTTLMSKPDVSRAARELIWGRVKVCGLTRLDDAHQAAAQGASYGGLIFVPASPRCVDEAQARALTEYDALHWVGVWVNEKPQEVARLAHELRLSAVQLHGEESPQYVEELRPLLPQGCEIWKACRVRHDIPSVADTAADRLVLDSWSATAHGGTGQTFDWSLLANHDLQRVVLGGGLNPDNGALAQEHRPFALDVNSGVEEAPGRKSPERLASFFAELRGPGRSR